MPYAQIDNNVVEISEEDVARTTANLENDHSIRSKRNSLLAETDWWATSDRTMTAAETQYRQDLRDVPDQSGFPNTITWPTKPS
tara:strand:+ start:141 stop:392 length:252 start_codon:yes stop_codon:yes gene_type:complete